MQAMSSKRAEALILGSLPVLGPAPSEALGPETDNASPGLQEAPRMGRAGVREPDRTGQHGRSGCGGGPGRGWGVQAPWAGGGEPRKGRRSQKEARVRRQSREEAAVLAGPETSHPKLGALTHDSRAKSGRAVMLGGGVGVLLGARGVVERTLTGNNMTGLVSE